MKNILVKDHNNRVDVYLNRQDKFNALNNELLAELAEVFTSLEKSASCRLIVLRSTNKKAFSSGVDLDQLLSFRSIEEARAFALHFDETMIRLLKFPKPLIAVIDGLAYGGGFALASIADLRIMTEKGSIAFPAGRLGAVLPPALTFMLNALVGIGVSRDLLMTGRTVLPEEAYNLRLVNRLIKSEDIEEVLTIETGQILKSSDTALQMTRRITNQQLLVEIEKYNLTGAENFAFLASTEEWQKRISGFFKGKIK